ncbi:MAG TPA: class II aldolase/adducin family protein [Candidatus Acidoferrales bacterium]|nr:class II aldolase/adducin family protein [Candidatus Acidoferrales bacterium]
MIPREPDRAASELVEYAALLWTRGLVFGTSGNVSLSLDSERILITPRGRSLRALRPGDCAIVDLRGNAGNDRVASSEWPLHAAAYRARADIGAVVHTHPTACVAWSKTGSLFSLDNVGARESLGTITWLPYRPPGTQDLADQCAAAFTAGFDTVVMADHGVSSIATSLEEAFVKTDLAEETARIALYTRLLEN